MKGNHKQLQNNDSNARQFFFEENQAENWPDSGFLFNTHPILVYSNNLRVAPPVLRTWANKRKLDEEKSKHAGLAEQNGFGPAFFHKILDWYPNPLGSFGTRVSNIKFILIFELEHTGF
jgi:hypothetical protein